MAEANDTFPYETRPTSVVPYVAPGEIEPTIQIELSEREGRPDDYATFANAVIATRNITEDLDAFSNYSTPFVKTDTDEYFKRLEDAYVMYLWLTFGGKTAWAKIRKHPAFHKRRAPKTGTEANVALAIYWKPETRQERSLCSSHATLLVFAVHHKIKPGTLATTIVKGTLGIARAFAADLHRQKGGRTAKAASDVTSVNLVWLDKDGKEHTRTILTHDKQLASLEGGKLKALHVLPAITPQSETDLAAAGALS